MSALPPEFEPASLAARIVRGAVEGDPVRLHGAITAALELHGLYGARRLVFAPALDEAVDHSRAVMGTVAAAIQRHLPAAV